MTVQTRSLALRGAALLALLFALALLSAPTASASYEQVGNFAGNPGELLHEDEGLHTNPARPEKVQLAGVGGMAVNYTGAGGVPAGSLYAASYKSIGENSGFRIARYNPDGSFSEAWEVLSKKVEELRESKGQEPYERCGPDGEVTHSHCPARTEGGSGRIDVDIDQTTGYVYAFQEALNGLEADPSITVYIADGSEVVTRLGENAAPSETISESPAKLHEGDRGGIAVNAAGEVYVFDHTQALENDRRRLALFRPKTPGDYSEYVYAGLGSDIVPDGRLPVADAAGNIYTAFEGGRVNKYEPGKSASPVCSFSFKKGGIESLTVNPKTGEVFFSSYLDHKLHRLDPCDTEGNFHEAQAFEFAPKRKNLTAMALDPQRSFGAGRGAGVLYAGSPTSEGGKSVGTYPDAEFETSLGYVFAPPLELAPVVGSESVSAVGSSSARLQATVNPKGNPTRYSFQYLDEPAYEANEPDERQALTVAASGGVFGLRFQGARLGGPARATLSAGSTIAGSLATATATATLSAAAGQGDLNGATGKGTLILASNVISSVSSEEGAFEVGQGIGGAGIPADTTITAVKTEAPLSSQELTISKPATKSTAHQKITSGTTTITALATAEGSFEAGQAIEGQGIQEGTTIAAVKAGELTLSKPVSGPQAAVALKAGSTTLSGLVAGIGSFEVGRPIEGEGIPANTTITALGGASLTISRPATKAGSGVAVSNPGPYPLASGEQIEGPGIAPATTIAAIKTGQITLSAPATASGSGVLLRAGLPASVSAAALQHALEALATIGAGGVEVSGGPGDGAGSSPYQLTFSGALENTDVPLLLADASGLSGGPATATVEGQHDGGGGFAGAAEVPLGGGLLEGSADLAVAAALSGLAPERAYRYRAVATSHCSPDDAAKVCEGDGASERFLTYPNSTPALPDGRAWEFVSPASKHGGQVLPAEPDVNSCTPKECKPGSAYNHSFPKQASSDGDAIVYEGTPFSFEEGAEVENQYLSRRTASGWQTTNLTPRSLFSKVGIGGYKAFSPDLSEGLLGQGVPSLSPQAPSDYPNLYRQPSADPLALAPLLSQANASFHCTSGTGPGSLVLNYVGASNDLSRVFFEANDMLIEGEAGGCGETNLYEWSGGALHLVNLGPGEEVLPGARFGSVLTATGAISEDGRRVFWTAKAGQLYERIDGTETVEIKDTGKFLSAAADGSSLLLGDGQLYGGPKTGPPALIADLTQGKGGFQGIAGQSEDLSHLYFVDTAVLDETPSSEGAKAQAGQPNLYLWDAGTEATTYLTTLLEQDNANKQGTWNTSSPNRTAEASPDGHFLVFLSRAQLTAYDNTGFCTVESGTENFHPGPCSEVYLYDASKEALSCPSCPPSGAPSLGHSVLRRVDQQGATAPQPRYLTDQGRLYFDTQNALSPYDTNGKVEDVYQFEPTEIGSCAQAAGCVSLISAGRGSADSNFLTIDPTGKNVFFTTRDRLNTPDQDEAIDLYDAREGGTPTVLPTVGECQGEACQPPLSPPNDSTPGSSSYHGAGNVEEPEAKPCPKGKVKKHGKCVKKHKAKKHHKRAHPRDAGHNRGAQK